MNTPDIRNKADISKAFIGFIYHNFY